MTKKTLSDRLNVGNDLTIDSIIGKREKFDKIFGGSSQIIIESKIINTIDLAGIQFLQYCISRSDLLGKPLSFNMKIASEPRELLNRCGFKKMSQELFL